MNLPIWPQFQAGICMGIYARTYYKLTGKADISSSPHITCILTAIFLAEPCLFAKLIHFGYTNSRFLKYSYSKFITVKPQWLEHWWIVYYGCFKLVFESEGKSFNSSRKQLYWDTLGIFFSIYHLFVCVEVLRPSEPIGVMSSAVSLPNHTFTGQA